MDRPRGVLNRIAFSVAFAILCCSGCARGLLVHGDWSLHVQRGCVSGCTETKGSPGAAADQPTPSTTPACRETPIGCESAGSRAEHGGLLSHALAHGEPRLRHGPTDDHFPRFHPLPTQPVFGNGTVDVCSSTPQTPQSPQTPEVVPSPADSPKPLNPPPAPLPETLPPTSGKTHGKKAIAAQEGRGTGNPSNWLFQPTYAEPAPAQRAITPLAEATRPTAAR